MSHFCKHFFCSTVVAALALLSACGADTAVADGVAPSGRQKILPDGGMADGGAMDTRINVSVEPISLSQFSKSIVTNGLSKSFREVTYAAEIPGKIDYLPVKLGGKIRRGRVLTRIDYTVLKAQSAQAQTAYALAKRTYDRLTASPDENLVSQQRIDEAKSEMLTAESALTIAEANTEKAVVRADYPGIVGEKFVEKGEYVTPGAPLLTVFDYRTIIVEASLAETLVSRIDRNATVDVRIDALAKSFTGTVDTLLPTADPESKTFALRIEVDNPNLEILIGMSATVRIPSIDVSDVIVVPRSAVIDEPDGRSIFVAQDGRAIKRRVRLGASQGDRVVLTDGAQKGDALIVVGHRGLEDGQRIHVVE